VLRVDGTFNISLSSVEIFGIYNKVIEKVKFTALFGATRLIFFDAMDWMATSVQVADIPTSNYIGDAYSDLTFAISRVVDSWYFQNSLYVSPEMAAHVFEGDHDGFTQIFKQPNLKSVKGSQQIGGCGTDIQLHSSKGAIGLRVDGVKNLQVNGLHVHDIFNVAELGSTCWCGPYDGPTVGNEDIEIQYGYTGTRAHGIVLDFAKGALREVVVEHVESFHGEANGMTVYKECNLTLENVAVNHIRAGVNLEAAEVDALTSPNLRPRACGVDIRQNTVVRVDEERGIQNGQNIVGFERCLDLNGSSKKRNDDDMHIGLLLLFFCLMYICAVVVVNEWSKNDDRKWNVNDGERIPLLL